MNAEEISMYKMFMQSGFDESVKAINPSVRLGIDLGTSYSKVVWRLGEESVAPVCFGKNKFHLNSYLMPSLVGFEKERMTFGYDASDSDYTITNFKMCLACESEVERHCGITKCSLTYWKPEYFAREIKGEETKFINSIFLAKLIAETKKIILAELVKKGFPVSVRPKWTANFAVPDTFIEQSSVASDFNEVLRMAWFLAEIFVLDSTVIESEKLLECYLAAKDLAIESLEILNNEEFGCSPYPEIGAEMASIVMVKTSEPGLYAFVDVGAGTVDASVFRYFRDENKANRPPYAAGVFKNGAAQLELRASRNTRFTAKQMKKIKEFYDEFTPEDRRKYAEEINLLVSVSEMIKNETKISLEQVFRVAFNKGKGSKSEWESWQKLRLILGGGGAKLKAYKDSAKQAFTIKGKEPKIPQTQTLPQPSDFQSNLPESEFHRFAVAYGLSYDIAKLPPIVFAKDVLNIAITERQNKNDHEELYAK